MGKRSGAAVMFMGTGSDVGKSLIVAGLARAFANRGLRVSPFKPQNMSNNAAVTADGGEIGRAQALQARACRLPPSIDMNPVLLKPQSETGAQIVLRGRVIGNARAAEWQTRKAGLLPAVLESFERLRSSSDLVLVEGAGSASEVNLRTGDIANMGFAEAAGLPVILIGDIDRGGVIASLVGTLDVVGAEDRSRIKAFLVNKFRGDPRLFDEGERFVSERTGLPSLGVVPWFAEASRLPPEDSLGLAGTGERGGIRIVVPHMPRVGNFDDLDPLRLEADVTVDIVEPGRALPGDADLVILPGAKSTLGDLAFLRERGWDIDLFAHVRRGGRVLGICGGHQMLGRRIEDPLGIEGPAGGADGLGLLAVDTVLTGDKTLARVTGFHPGFGTPIEGYEMHVGRTTGPGLDRPFLTIEGRPEGAVSGEGRVMGCYVHGLFATDAFRHAFLNSIRPRVRSALDYEATIDDTLDALAAHLAAHLDLERLARIAGV